MPYSLQELEIEDELILSWLNSCGRNGQLAKYPSTVRFLLIFWLVGELNAKNLLTVTLLFICRTIPTQESRQTATSTVKSSRGIRSLLSTPNTTWANKHGYEQPLCSEPKNATRAECECCMIWQVNVSIFKFYWNRFLSVPQTKKRSDLRRCLRRY